jgi:hypothetical protein
MVKFNLVLWLFSFALQCMLLTVLFGRGIFRRVPVFTSLIGFYILRSIGLYAVSSHLRHADYVLVFSVLAAVDIILQTFVAWELFSAVMCSPGVGLSSNAVGSEGFETAPQNMPLLRRLAIFALFLITASVFAFLVSTHIHANPRVPIDRGVLFSAALFIMVFLASQLRETSRLVRLLVGGLAFYAGASIACQMGRTFAGVQQDAVMFNRWSYAESAAYVVVIFFWVIVLPETGNVRGAGTLK